MRNTKGKYILHSFALLLFVIVLFISCYTPSPLYGKWVDNYNNSITFNSDSTFSAVIYNDSKAKTENYSGEYTVMDNIISFDTESGSNVTTWQLDGAALYLNWKINGIDTNLVLFHISK